MQKRVICTLLASLLTGISVAQAANQLSIVNHTDRGLNFIIGINPQILPDFPDKFTVSKNDVATSQVLDIDKEAYIRAEDDSKHSAFFGVNVENQKTKIHGYISKGIAYSWKEETVTFCTPEKYKQDGLCL